MGMRKKLSSLLRKDFKTSEFKATVNLAISRLAVFKKQRKARCAIARSDVVELLKIGNHERAIIRVEQVIKEQNMFDVYVSLESYCHFVIERVNLIEQEKICPEELMEAVSTLIYASTRCGDLPELQEIRMIFMSRYGKEFVARATELRNNCGVNPKIIQKLSTRMPSLENKMNMLKEIASDNKIVLEIGETVLATASEHQEVVPEDINFEKDFSDSPKMNIKYRDVAHAAQAAFESATYAAAAARAAVELSRSDHDNPKTTNLRPSKESVEKSKEPSVQDSESLSDSSSDSGDDKIEEIKVVFDESDGEKDRESRESDKKFPLKSENFAADVVEPLNVNRRPISVRTKRTNGR